MIERSTIIAEFIDKDDTVPKSKAFFLSVIAEMEDDDGKIDVYIRIISKESFDEIQPGEVVVDVKVSGKITNPLEIVAVYLLKAVAHFGLCASVKMVYTAGVICYRSYDQSKQQMPVLPIKDRCRDVFHRLPNQKQEMVHAAKLALAMCTAEALLGPILIP
jgi:hypothetical protein